MAAISFSNGTLQQWRNLIAWGGSQHLKLPDGGGWQPNNTSPTKRSCCLHNHGWIGRHAFQNYNAKRRLSLVTMVVATRLHVHLQFWSSTFISHVCCCPIPLGVFNLREKLQSNPSASIRHTLAHHLRTNSRTNSLTNSRTLRARTRALSDGSALRENARDVKRAWGK